MKTETMADIVAMLRANARGERFDDFSFTSLADRIEAAAKYADAMCRKNEEAAFKRGQSATGSAAAMREALEDSNGLLREIRGEWRDAAEAQIEDNNAALAAPARKCDVGTAQEQIDRFHEFCHSNRVYIDEFHGYDCRPDCPIGKIVDRDNKFCDNCWAAWAQMPYAPAQEGGAE